MRTTQYQSWTIFLVTVLLIAAVMTALRRFDPITQFDTQGYLDFPWSNWSEALNYQRTWGYPAFLKIFEVLNEPISIVPFIQFVISVIACGTWMAVLFRCGWRAAHCIAATLPILTTSMVIDYSPLLTPDSLAQALGILAVAFWMLFVYRVPGILKYFGIAIFVFLAYQTKPSYLFLLGFIPIGGTIARWWLFKDKRDWHMVGVKLALLTFVPFFAWCTYRYVQVGHFGLVAFGGYNVIGITGQLLEDGMIEDIANDVRPLAEKILENRKTVSNWESRYSYSVFEEQYNPMVWKIAIPAAKSVYDEDSRTINLQLSRLSREIIKLKPTGYLFWLALAAKHALTGCIEVTIRNPLVVLACVLMLVGHMRSWVRRHRVIVLTHNSLFVKANTREYQTIVWMSLGYAFCSLMLVILVEAPIARYCAPAAVFLPSFFGMLAADLWLFDSGCNPTNPTSPP